MDQQQSRPTLVLLIIKAKEQKKVISFSFRNAVDPTCGGYILWFEVNIWLETQTQWPLKIRWDRSFFLSME